MCVTLHFGKPTNCSRDNRILHHGGPPLACNIALRYHGFQARSYLCPGRADSRRAPLARCWRAEGTLGSISALPRQSVSPKRSRECKTHTGQ